MTDVEFSAAPDAFTHENECWARRKAPVVIGGPTHTHVCRELVDEQAHHDGPHHCTCGSEW